MIFLIINFSYGFITYTDQRQYNSVSEDCLKYVSEKNINSEDIVMIVDSKSDLLLNNLMSFTTVIVVNSENKLNYNNNQIYYGLGRINYFILNTFPNKMEIIIKKLIKLEVFNSRGNFIVMLHNLTFYDHNKILSNSFEILWKFNIYNTLILNVDKSSCDILTWFPFDFKSKCGLNTKNIIKIDKYSDNEYNNITNLLVTETIQKNFNEIFFNKDKKSFGIFEIKYFTKNTIKMKSYIKNDVRQLIKERSPHFLKKIPNDLQGCPFQCGLIISPPFVTPDNIIWYGLEQKLFRDIASFMNFQLIEEFTSYENFTRFNKVCSFDFYLKTQNLLFCFKIIEFPTNATTRQVIE